MNVTTHLAGLSTVYFFSIACRPILQSQIRYDVHLFLRPKYWSAEEAGKRARETENAVQLGIDREAIVAKMVEKEVKRKKQKKKDKKAVTGEAKKDKSKDKDKVKKKKKKVKTKTTKKRKKKSSSSSSSSSSSIF